MGIPVGFHFRIVARIIGYQEQVLGRDVHPETLHIYFLQGLLRKTVSQYNILQPHEGTVFYRSEEHTSELQSLMRISYAVFCLKKKNNKTKPYNIHTEHNR